VTRLQRALDREQCIAAVAKALSEGRPLIELTEELGRSYKQILRYKDSLMKKLQGETETTVAEYRAAQLDELADLEALCEDPKIKPDRKVELLHSIIQTKIKLLGTAAPTKSIVGHVSGPQLDALYLDVREVLIDLDKSAQEEGLQLLREWAATRKKPVITSVPGLLEASDADFS
jgi:hypothetical protein